MNITVISCAGIVTLTAEEGNKRYVGSTNTAKAAYKRLQQKVRLGLDFQTDLGRWESIQEHEFAITPHLAEAMEDSELAYRRYAYHIEVDTVVKLPCSHCEGTGTVTTGHSSEDYQDVPCPHCSLDYSPQEDEYRDEVCYVSVF